MQRRRAITMIDRKTQFDFDDDPAGAFIPLAVRYLLGELNEHERDQLEAELMDSAEKRDAFVDICIQSRFITARAGVDLPEQTNPATFEFEELFSEEPTHEKASTPPSFGYLSDVRQGWASVCSSGWPMAYLIATLIFGIGITIAAITHVSEPVQVALDLPSTSPVNSIPQARSEVVGQISGIADCKWAGADKVSREVVLGATYQLVSGLIEITYNSGAKVILQGPCTYEVDSRNGGFLTIGKLTARVESGKGRRATEGEEMHIAKRQLQNASCQSPNLKIQKSGNPSPSAIQYPLFTIKTPTAIVTDFGTEFGVEVHQNQTTVVSVFQGIVQTERLASNGTAGEKRRLMAGEAVCCETGEKNIRTAEYRPEHFVRSLELVEDLGEFKESRLGNRWTFDTPNAGNRWSLSARPGFLRICLYNACQDSWEDRGTAPVLYVRPPIPSVQFSMETYIDLAGGNNGVSRKDTIGGLAVYDASRGNFALTFGLAHNSQGEDSSNAEREVALQSPRKDHVRLAVESDAAYLRLVRNGAKWIAYYKTDAVAPWIHVGTVDESELAGGAPVDPCIGLFCKSFDKIHPGGPGACIDFDYFRIQNASEPAEAAK